MRISAYILAGDPAWIEASVMSYYDLVDRIVVSYDENGLGWTGGPLAVDESLNRLRAIDREGKFIYSPGHYARLDRKPMENDTYQRQCALDEAGEGADWVLQLDTDEVVASFEPFKACLTEADAQHFEALLYPSRWLYQQVGEQTFLEECTRFWQAVPGYPGPVAVRKGIKLRNARQCEAKHYCVGFNSRSLRYMPTANRTFHRALAVDDGILHFSWARSDDKMVAKSRSSSHSKDFDWQPRLKHWRWAAAHPKLAVASTPLQKPSLRRCLRLATLNVDRSHETLSSPSR